MIRIRPARSDEIDALAEIGIAAWKKGIKPRSMILEVRLEKLG